MTEPRYSWLENKTTGLSCAYCGQDIEHNETFILLELQQATTKLHVDCAAHYAALLQCAVDAHAVSPTQIPLF